MCAIVVLNASISILVLTRLVVQLIPSTILVVCFFLFSTIHFCNQNKLLLHGTVKKFYCLSLKCKTIRFHLIILLSMYDSYMILYFITSNFVVWNKKRKEWAEGTLLVLL